MHGIESTQEAIHKIGASNTESNESAESSDKHVQDKQTTIVNHYNNALINYLKKKDCLISSNLFI